MKLEFDVHLYGSLRGYQELSKSTGLQATESGLLNVTGFGDISDVSVQASMDSHPIVCGRPLPSGRIALTRCFSGGKDVAGRVTIELRTIVVSSEAWEYLRVGRLELLFSDLQVWNRENFEMPTMQSIEVDYPQSPKRISPELHIIFNKLAENPHASFACVHSQSRDQAILSLLSNLPSADFRKLSWGIRMLSTGLKLSICTLHPKITLIGNVFEIRFPAGKIHDAFTNEMTNTPWNLPSIFASVLIDSETPDMRLSSVKHVPKRKKPLVLPAVWSLIILLVIAVLFWPTSEDEPTTTNEIAPPQNKTTDAEPKHIYTMQDAEKDTKKAETDAESFVLIAAKAVTSTKADVVVAKDKHSAADESRDVAYAAAEAAQGAAKAAENRAEEANKAKDVANAEYQDAKTNAEDAAKASKDTTDVATAVANLINADTWSVDAQLEIDLANKEVENAVREAETYMKNAEDNRDKAKDALELANDEAETALENSKLAKKAASDANEALKDATTEANRAKENAENAKHKIDKVQEEHRKAKKEASKTFDPKEQVDKAEYAAFNAKKFAEAAEKFSIAATKNKDAAEDAAEAAKRFAEAAKQFAEAAKQFADSASNNKDTAEDAAKAASDAKKATQQALRNAVDSKVAAELSRGVLVKAIEAEKAKKLIDDMHENHDYYSSLSDNSEEKEKLLDEYKETRKKLSAVRDSLESFGQRKKKHESKEFSAWYIKRISFIELRDALREWEAVKSLIEKMDMEDTSQRDLLKLISKHKTDSGDVKLETDFDISVEFTEISEKISLFLQLEQRLPNFFSWLEDYQILRNRELVAIKETKKKWEEAYAMSTESDDCIWKSSVRQLSWGKARELKELGGKAKLLCENILKVDVEEIDRLNDSLDLKELLEEWLPCIKEIYNQAEELNKLTKELGWINTEDM